MSGFKLCECGQKPVLLVNRAGLRVTGDYRVCCARTPSCPSSTAWYGEEAEAIAAWNTRPEPVAVTAEEVARAVLSHTRCEECSVAIGGDPEPGCCIFSVTTALLALLREKGLTL